MFAIQSALEKKNIHEERFLHVTDTTEIFKKSWQKFVDSE